MDFCNSKVLLSHHWSFYLQRHPIFAQDEIYLTSSQHEHPKVINFPIGSSIDMGKLVKKLPSNWYPDLFIAKVDSYFNIIPRNVETLKGPKVLILGDTQHGDDPLNNMIEYAKSEKYDFYITDHKRHHLWYYWLAGITNLYWLPGLFLNPPNETFNWQEFQDPKLDNKFFQGKAIFVGQAGKYHPRRKRILQYASDHLNNFWWGQLNQRDSLKAFAAADTALNVSLNGDLNLRIFEILSAKGFLLTDQLTDESGINLLLNEGEEYESFANASEMIDKIKYFSSYPDLISKYRQKGHRRYLREYSPDKMIAVFNDLLQGNTIENRFTTKSINRIQYCQDTEFSRARISLYQVIQELHQKWENLEILLDARIKFTSVADFLDLPRVNVTLTNYEDSYVNNLELYLRQSGNLNRVNFVKNAQPDQRFNIIITSVCDPHFLSQLQNDISIVISNDYRGLELSSQEADLRDFVPNREDVDDSFFVLGRNNSQLSSSQFHVSEKATTKESFNNNFSSEPSSYSNTSGLNPSEKSNQQIGRNPVLPGQENFTVCVVHPNENAYSETFIRAHIERLPAKVIDLPRVWFPLRHNKASLKQFLLENHVDAVLAEFGPAGVAILEVCKEAQVPLIVHFHGFDANHCSVITGEAGQRYPELFEYASVIVAPSMFIQKRLLNLNAPAEKIRVNPNGVDTSMFSSTNSALSSPIFITVSRFVDVKGPHLSLLAFKKVVEHCKEARLIMVGDGPLLESSKQIVRALKISSSVQFLGVQKPSEVSALMRTSRALIQHSIRTSDGQCEAQGVVFLEAGASGLPVVATKSGGIPEVVLNGKTGFLVDEGDIDKMAECMLRLAEDPTLASQLGKAARERICAKFSMEKSISGLWQIIETAIQEDRKSKLIGNFNLREINLIIFPDWSQQEDSLLQDLASAIRAIATHPDNNRITLLIDTGNISEEDANLALSDVVMYLLMEEGLDISEETEISLTGKLSAMQWEALLPSIQARLVLENENQEAIAKHGVEKLSKIQTYYRTNVLKSM